MQERGEGKMHEISGDCQILGEFFEDCDYLRFMSVSN